MDVHGGVVEFEGLEELDGAVAVAGPEHAEVREVQREERHPGADAVDRDLFRDLRLLLEAEGFVVLELDEEGRHLVVAEHVLGLRVEPARAEGAVEIGHALALHHDLGGQHKVAHLQRGGHEVHAGLVQQVGQARPELPHVHHHLPALGAGQALDAGALCVVVFVCVG